MSETIQLVCPECGNTLELPEGLEEFSCLYCGKRQRTASVLALNSRSETQYDRLRAELRERLAETVTRYPNYFKKVTKKDYIDTFSAYERENSDVLTDLDVCVRLRPERAEQSVQEICADFLDALQAHMQQNPKWQKKGGRQNLLFDVKAVLAVFLTPLARKLKLECAEQFRTELHRQWTERFPQEVWTPGDYDVIVGGFRKGKLCFITTAVCAQEGKPDDCAELTAFRAFRDGWLTEHGGAPLIARYYEIAPAIVTAMRYCDDTAARCAELRGQWLTPCYRALQEARYADCRERYADMVRTLERRYLQS